MSDIINATQVVNVKVSSIRPEYHNLEEWCSNPNHVYIGRKGIVFIRNQRYPLSDSIWSNPYKIGKDGNREEVLVKYELYIRNKLENHPILKEQLIQLKNKKLGCWCAPEPCHGDILIKMINEFC